MSEKSTLKKNAEEPNRIVELPPFPPVDFEVSHDWTLDAAKEISEYLLIGWHHSTDTGQSAIASIIAKHSRAHVTND